MLSTARNAAAVVLALWAMPGAAYAGDAGTLGIWTTAAELADRPMLGPAWEEVLETANEPLGSPNISDQTNQADIRVLAKALVYARTGAAPLRWDVASGCAQAIGTESGGTTLALGRNLLGYVIAADLVDLPPTVKMTFSAWLDDVRTEVLLNRTLISTHEDRPNNWGTHAGASRMAAALYLGDTADFEAAAEVFHGWLGNRDVYDNFFYGELWWQSGPQTPVGINPVGAMIDGHLVDGVLPDDQRRGGPFQWPPPKVNYVYEALQGAIVQAVILHRQGHDVWNWEEQALLRAYLWLHEQADFPAEGDDGWQPHLVNWHYGACLPAPTPAIPGKNMGWTDWTHHVCVADLDGDGDVGTGDMLALLGAWGADLVCNADVNGDGTVAAADLLMLIGLWGPCY